MLGTFTVCGFSWRQDNIQTTNFALDIDMEFLWVDGMDDMSVPPFNLGRFRRQLSFGLTS